MSKIIPVPDGPMPAGQAWYPLLGEWGPPLWFGDDSGNDLDWDPFDTENELDPHLWQTKEGEVLLISKLETSHLRNILRMLERKHGPGSLARLGKTEARVRNLTNEWLRRF